MKLIKMMKIAYVHINSDVVAGQEKVLINIINGINRDKFQPIVILPEEGIFAEALRENNIQIKFINLARLRIKNPFPYLRTIYQLYVFLKKEGVGIIHTSGLFPNQYCVIAAKLAKIPCICHIHTTAYTNKDLTNSLLKYSDLAITVSRGVKEVMKKTHINENKIEVIYNGVDPNCYKVDTEKVKKIKEGLGITAASKIIGQVGQIIKRKGIYYFIKMAETIIKQRKDIRFLLVGDDKYEPGYMKKMEELVNKLNLSDFIIFTGYREEIPELISIMDITVLNALQEGLGMVLIEASLLNKPVVVTDILGCNEVIENNITGLLVPPKDYNAMAEQVLKILNNNSFAKKLTDNAKNKMLREFSLKQQIEQISNIYEHYIKN